MGPNAALRASGCDNEAALVVPCQYHCVCLAGSQNISHMPLPAAELPAQPEVLGPPVEPEGPVHGGGWAPQNPDGLPKGASTKVEEGAGCTLGSGCSLGWPSRVAAVRNTSKKGRRLPSGL